MEMVYEGSRTGLKGNLNLEGGEEPMKETQMMRGGEDRIKSRGQEGGRCWDAAERGHGHQDCKKRVHGSFTENKMMLLFSETE